MANKIYRAFGRTVRSFVDLPATEIEAGPIDWDFVLEGESAPPSDGMHTEDLAAGDDGFEAKGLARFTFADNRILVRPAPGVQATDLISTLTGSLAALLLARAGHYVLHGTTLRYRDRLVILCGNAGAGKSTQASFLVRNGWDLIADDVSPITWSGNRASVHRGFQSMRLFPDSLGLIGMDADAYPKLYAGTTKCLVDFGPPRHFERDQTASVAGVILLEESDRFLLEKLPERVGLISLLSLQHPTAAIVYDTTAERRAAAFRGGSQLAQNVPVVRVCRPKTRESLSETAHALLKLVS